MKYTVFFLTILAMSSFVATEKALDTVKTLLTNMNTEIVKEQTDADARNKKDTEKCSQKIGDAMALVTQREKDVNDLKDHISFLENEKKERETDQADREKRINDNNDLLKKFKSERCENNLLFIKNLREHLESIDLMKLLRGEVDNYFNSKKPVKTAFLERFAEFSHLLSEEHRQIFLELSDAVQTLPEVDPLTDATNKASTQKGRTTEEIGTEHVDNNQGELAALEHVAHEKVDKYTEDLHKKILAMIDALIKHLDESRDVISKDEIHAAEDFAKFQTNLEKENELLQAKVEELKKEIINLTNQLNNANNQLEKRDNLKKQAKEELKTIQTICQEKADYFAKETIRRNGELETVDNAVKVFNNLYDNLSKRVRERADNIALGQAAGIDLEGHVVANAPGAQATLKFNIEERKSVAF
jgi:hypothetical protein